MLKTGKQFLTHVVPAVLKPIRVLWNELISFIFFSFAVLCGFASWKKFDRGEASLGYLVAGMLFALLLLWYGLSSLRRARKIAKS